MKIDLKDFPEWLKKKAIAMPVQAKTGLMSAGQKSIGILQQATRSAPSANPNGIGIGAVDTGNYLRSWRVTSTSNSVRVANTASYAGIIESGRRPGRMPNLTAINNWARRRLGLSKQEAERATWPIARAIAARGLLARKVMTNVAGHIKDLAIQEVRKALTSEWGKK